MPTLAERLGYTADDRLVIISCDDLGSCHAANEGVFAALHDGVASPWRRNHQRRTGGDAVVRARAGDDLGVHLTLNCEHPNYRWGPITHAPSLHSGEAGFPRSVDDLWEHADPEEVLRECRAQIERALAWGIDVTHLAPHLTAITLRPEFFDVYIELAVEFKLPVRLPSTISKDDAGFPFRDLAADEGVLFPDHFDHDWRAGSRERVYDAIAKLRPGVTEIHVQPAIDTPEVQAISESAPGWIDDLALVTTDQKLRFLLADSGAILIGYRQLRDAMRASEAISR